MNTIAFRGFGPLFTTPVPTLRRALSGIWRLPRQVLQFYRNRRHMVALADMTDHELNDIGLIRADIVAASAMPLAEDPTAALAGIVQERRRWRRGR
jgi:uncharacterized protein YjiS (DUF1127 family)